MIERQITVDFEPVALSKELLTALQPIGNAGIEISEDIAKVDVDDDQANNDTFDSVVSAHDCSAEVNERKRDAIRTERDHRLHVAECRVFRHHRETRLVGRGQRANTTELLTKIDEVDDYIEALCAFPTICDIDNPDWPVEPVE